MKPTIQRIPVEEPAWQCGMIVARRLVEAGYETYFAGGCVRDLLLDRPSRDVDIATSAKPEEVKRLFPKVLMTGALFGVCRVILPDGAAEVATFRKDGLYLDHRRPSSISAASSKEDVKRRDFTINGMLLEPGSRDVLDHVGGLDDLRARIIRAIGDPEARLQEDHLRMLRAVRFACELGFSIEETTRRAIAANASLIASVSAERLRDELIKILMSPSPALGLRLMKETGILPAALPDVAAMDGVPQPPEYHPEGDVLTHTALLLEQTDDEPLAVRLAALLHDIGKPATFTHEPGDRIRFNRHESVGAGMADDLLKRLRMTNDLREHVVSMVKMHMRFPAAPEMRAAKLKRFLAMPRFEDHLALHRLDCLASHRKLDRYEFVKEKLAEFGQEGVDPPALLRGRDLLAMGFQEGPEIGKALHLVREAQLEGTIQSSDEARELIQRQFVHEEA